MDQLEHSIAQDSPPQRQRPHWRSCQYEAVTPAKVAFGGRLRQAREIAGLNLTEASQAIGYSQPVQLSLMEAGQRMPPLKVLLALRDLYGTTMDYLCGHAWCSDRDPLAAMQALVAARVTAEVRGLIGTLSAIGAAATRDLKPDAGRMLGLARCALEAHAALRRVRDLQPDFDEECRGAATLVSKLDLAADMASEHLAAVARAQRVLAAGRTDLAGLLVDGLRANDGEIVWPSLAQVPPLAAADLADDEDAP